MTCTKVSSILQKITRPNNRERMRKHLPTLTLTSLSYEVSKCVFDKCAICEKLTWEIIFKFQNRFLLNIEYKHIGFFVKLCNKPSKLYDMDDT